ncbi:MAG: PstS family phosphate ABC transporter substrate-binding protein [Coleofasciculus sp. B1-GNL1-01]|uniref:PstS family phosphate ABC transporter substrate-binding protein n=1 Tax=Coleofasciculus sp. B1-GNL1-01 TaxID=3068484 RepID=UPI0032F0DDAA
MNTTPQQLVFRLSTVAIALSFAVGLNSCTSNVQSQQPQPINIDGSSTVYPITQAVVQEFNNTTETPVDVSVGFSGTGGGFGKFCAGETDINNASRPINTQEMEACKQAGVPYIELPVGFDAITVVVNPENDWADSITVQELKTMWEPAAQRKITNWNQVRQSWPNRPLNLYGPGTDSGTFDYFTEAIVGKAGASRSDYTASEDDDILQQAVSQNPNALGYFGLAYYETNKDDLKAVAVEDGNEPVLPSPKTVEQAEYQPLSRPLFIYINADKTQKNPALRKFVEFYLEQAPEVVRSVGYVPLPDDGYHLIEVKFYNSKTGTVFDGQSEFNLTIGELLRKQPKF